MKKIISLGLVIMMCHAVGDNKMTLSSFEQLTYLD